MATLYPKTSLSIKTIDPNLNSKTFSVGYVNPDVEDGTLKELAVKLTDLSNNTFSEVFKTTQTDITNASTDTDVVRVPLISSSDFLSMDSTTWKAYLAEKSPSGSANIRYSMVSPAGSNESSPLDVDFFTLRNAPNITNSKDYADFVSARLLSTTGTKPFVKIVQTESGVWYFETTGTGTFKISMNGSNNGIPAILQDIFDNITQPSSGAQWTIESAGGNVALRYEGTV